MFLVEVVDEHAQHPQQRGDHLGLFPGGQAQLVEGVIDVLPMGEIPGLDNRAVLVILQGLGCQGGW